MSCNATVVFQMIYSPKIVIFLASKASFPTHTHIILNLIFLLFEKSSDQNKLTRGTYKKKHGSMAQVSLSDQESRGIMREPLSEMEI